MNEGSIKPWNNVCDLTTSAMSALVDVEQALIGVDGDRLTPNEFRALLWVRCSLATLYGIRVDEAVGDPAMAAFLGGSNPN
ncbi:MAG TPA: hypothetical protein VFH58_11875 [Acidimicrobiales bacterium]|nr:hypothetical protein [Acidimicrobiales bacterium]